MEMNNEEIIHNLLYKDINDKMDQSESIVNEKMLQEKQREIPNTLLNLNDTHQSFEVMSNDYILCEPMSFAFDTSNDDNNQNDYLNTDFKQTVKPNISMRVKTNIENEIKPKTVHKKIVVNELLSEKLNSQLSIDILKDFQLKILKYKQKNIDNQGENIIIPVKNKKGRLADHRKKSNKFQTKDSIKYFK